MSPRAVLALSFALFACGATPPPSPAPEAPRRPGREPASPPGTEGLRASPCAGALELRGSAELRSFEPGARSLAGRSALELRGGPRGLRGWSSSRPGALGFEEGPGDAITIVAAEPGATLVRFVPETANEEVSVLVSVPQFVDVEADGELGAMLAETLGVGGLEREVFAEAKRAIDAIFSRVNVRVVWRVGLGERLPPQLEPGGFAEGRFIRATLHSALESCVTRGSSLAYTEFGGYAEGESTKRLVNAPVHVCPAIFARHPDTLAWMVRSRARLLQSAEGKAVYVNAIGRATAETLAHEIGHQLLGCDTRGERRFFRCHDRLPVSLMNKAGERSFTARTGLSLKPTQYSSVGRDDFPAPGTYEDRGVEAINRLPPDGQAVLDRILPVPPALVEMAPCPSSPAPK